MGVSKIEVQNQGPKWGSQIRVPNQGPKSGSRIRVPNRGLKSGSQIGVLKWGPKSGSQIGVPNRGPISGSQIRVTNRGPKSGSHIGVPNQGPKLSSHIIPQIRVPCRPQNWAPKKYHISLYFTNNIDGIISNPIAMQVKIHHERPSKQHESACQRLSQHECSDSLCNKCSDE
jgi:hypothetical protein